MGTETIAIDGEAHAVGDEECADCWGEYPQPHECGGLMHAQFIDESYDSVMLGYLCDKCGEDTADE